MNKSIFKNQWDAVALASVVLLVFSFALGGASREHALRLAMIELAALPLLVMAAGRLIKDDAWRQHRFLLGLLAALVAIPLIQLIPLPAAVWTGLPGRDQLVLALEITGLAPGWSPMTLTPDKTWASALALVPPAAMLLAVLSLTHIQRQRLVQVCIAAAIASILLGAAQLASGGDSLYLWSWTGAGSVTGFFANRNHLASLLLITLPFAITFGAATLRRRDQRTTALWIGGLFAGLVVVALAAIRSRAGLTLFAPVMVFSLLAETLRLQAPQIYMMSLGLLLILCVLYLPGGLASLRWATFSGWRDDLRQAWRQDVVQGWRDLRKPKAGKVAP